MSKSRNNKKRREDPDLDDDDERVLFFIPSAGINIEVLVFYIKNYLGQDSDAEPGVHPRERDTDGYFIKSRLSLNAVMVADLKQDSEDWRDEKKRKRPRTGYSDSETAVRRLEAGPTGRPSIPKKTQELAAARRAESVQPMGQGMSQPINTQQPTTRHGAQQDTTMQTGSYAPNVYQPDPTQRHPTTYSGQQSTFSYASPTVGQNRPPPAINLNVNMNTASYTQNVPQRHQSPPQSNILPSIEGRSEFYNTPAPQYEERDSKRDNKPTPPSQPPSSGTHGFSNYPTAGSRHDRPAPGR